MEEKRKDIEEDAITDLTDEEKAIVERQIHAVKEPKEPEKPAMKEDAPAEMPFSGERYRFEELNGKKEPIVTWISMGALILSIVALMLSLWELAIPPIICGVIGIAGAVYARKRYGYFEGKALAALILGIFGTVLGLYFGILKLL